MRQTALKCFYEFEISAITNEVDMISRALLGKKSIVFLPGRTASDSLAR